ncbi:MAG: hypothetical protein ABIH65_00520 [Nanoarchaeota archaeon]
MNIIDKSFEQQRANQVNGLLKKAFGKTARGNLSGYELPLTEDPELGYIATGVTGIPSLFYQKVIGHFTKKDGSEFKILPEYIEQAKKFVSFYKELFRQEVTIILDPKANRGNAY